MSLSHASTESGTTARSGRHARPGWRVIAWYRREWLRVTTALLISLFFIQSGCATEKPADTVWLLSSRASGDYQEVIDAFMHRLATATAPQPKVLVINADTDADALTVRSASEKPALIVTIGGSAARLAQAMPRTQPVLNILIPRLLYEQLTSRGGARSALYIDQPFERQLNLCRLVVPDLRHVAVLFGPTSQGADDDLQSAAEESGINLMTRHVAAGTNPNVALNDVLDDSQLLLALPDPDVFTRYTVAGLLLTAYHHGVPVIGFSAGYVKAGALAAVYSTPEQIGRDAADMVLAADTGSGWVLPPPRYPTEFIVTVNRQVGRSLSLKLPDDAELHQSLSRQEQVQR